MPPEITFDRKSLKIDGERKIIISGSMHYYRLPSKELWRHRLARLKEMGVNCVDIYFYWGYHSPEPGVYDFSDMRDVDALMDMIEEEGLWLMARPGPYICSEIDGGGFPAWMLARDDMSYRCKKGGKFDYDEEYMKYVREWFEQIVPKIAKRENLLLFQIENEYNFVHPPAFAWKLQKQLLKIFGPNMLFNLQMLGPARALMKMAQKRSMKSKDHVQSNRYMKELYSMSRELGITAPIFHNDIEAAMQRFVDVDIVGIDDYPVKTFEIDWHDRGHVFSGLDVLEEGHAAHGVECPILLGELQGGWFDGWGMQGYEFNRRRLGPEAMDITLKTALSQGASIINVFMAAGGTTWGYTGSPDVYTSFDYGAPITEGGRPSARSKAMKSFIEFAMAHEKDLVESVPGPPGCSLSPGLHCFARHALSGRRYLFVRNMTKEAQAMNVGAQRISLSPTTMTILAVEEDDTISDRCDPATDTSGYVFPETQVPELNPWKFGMVSRPLDPEYDDSGWKKLSAEGPLDIDTAGLHYGYVWYRGRLREKIGSFRLDARHCWAAYLNGELLAAYGNHNNRLGAGDDMADTIKVKVPDSYYRDGDNVLVILVESLGHTKGFLEDLHQRRGIVSIDTGDAVSEWCVRGGLLEGESGMTPRVDFGSIEVNFEEEVTVPHKWPSGRQGVGLYQTTFTLDLDGPDDPPVGLHIPEGAEKMNIYLNGWLVGRLWASEGPQDLFYLPAGLLNEKGENHLAIAVWRWEAAAHLGRAHLELHP